MDNSLFDTMPPFLYAYRKEFGKDETIFRLCVEAMPLIDNACNRSIVSYREIRVKQYEDGTKTYNYVKDGVCLFQTRGDTLNAALRRMSDTLNDFNISIDKHCEFILTEENMIVFIKGYHRVPMTPEEAKKWLERGE